jgi:hypothetical protein
MPVALGRALVGTLEQARPDLRGGLRLDELLDDPFQARADRVGHLPGAERVEQVGQVRLVMGHWRDLLDVDLG